MTDMTTVVDSIAPKPVGIDWRKYLEEVHGIKVHPEADDYPMLGDAELRVLGNDIGKNGLVEPVVLYKPNPEIEEDHLIDGRNRFAGLALVLDEDGFAEHFKAILDDTHALRNLRKLHRWTAPRYVDDQDIKGDIKGYIASLNVHRRHLTTAQKRELIDKLIKAQPEKSALQIAKQAKSSPTTVSARRTKLETAGDVSKLETRTDTKGRQQPATKTRAGTMPKPRRGADPGWQTQAFESIRKRGERWITLGEVFGEIAPHIPLYVAMRHAARGGRSSKAGEVEARWSCFRHYIRELPLQIDPDKKGRYRFAADVRVRVNPPGRDCPQCGSPLYPRYWKHLIGFSPGVCLKCGLIEPKLRAAAAANADKVVKSPATETPPADIWAEQTAKVVTLRPAPPPPQPAPTPAPGALRDPKPSDAGRVQNAILNAHLTLKGIDNADLEAACRDLDANQIAQCIEWIEGAQRRLRAVHDAMKNAMWTQTAGP